MELIERYLQAVGRELPRDRRDDILAELRSSLYDALESSEQPDEETVATIIKDMGSPQQVAAAYYPAGQYLIGPALFPLFRLVLAIVFTAVVGAQLLAVTLALVLGRGAPDVLRAFGDILGSLPAALGSVVVVFWLLQKFEVRPTPGGVFNPRDLPPLEPATEPISRGEQVFSIIFSVVFLVLLARFMRDGGFAWSADMPLLRNPIIDRFFPWICLAILADIVMDIVLLWRGRWQASTRIASILVNLFGLGVLAFLIREHNVYLTEAGMPGLFPSLGFIPALLEAGNLQTASMVVVRMILASVAVGVTVDTIVKLYRLFRAGTRSLAAPTGLPPAGVSGAGHRV